VECAPIKAALVSHSRPSAANLSHRALNPVW
jgi:hypothetical protein